MADQPHRQQAAEGGAQSVAGGLQADRQRPPALAGVLGGNHVAAGEDAADAQASEAAQQGQLRRRLAEGGKQHANTAQQQTEEDQRTTAEVVGPGGDEQRAGGHAEQPGAEQ
ncbi:hypothetical protein D9M70_541630 [compost metagenome]